MSEMEKKPPPEGEQFSRFQKIAQALVRVDKSDVPRHEPKKRTSVEWSAGEDRYE